MKKFLISVGIGDCLWTVPDCVADITALINENANTVTVKVVYNNEGYKEYIFPVSFLIQYHLSGIMEYIMLKEDWIELMTKWEAVQIETRKTEDLEIIIELEKIEAPDCWI